MSERFHVNRALTKGTVHVEGAEVHHFTVSRLRPGDEVRLFNGDGHEYRAKIEELGKRAVVVDVMEILSPQRELSRGVVIASAVPKGDREHFLVEKLTELGVTRFIPLRTSRSIVQPRAERLQKYVVEACKQCGRNVLMQIDEPVEWKSFLARSDVPKIRWLAHPGEATSIREVSCAGDVLYAVGPEGGFSGEEVEAARAAGWRMVNLGPRILRVETAALALAAWSALGVEP